MQALRCDATHARAWYNLGLLQAQTGRAAQAVASLREAGRLEPQTAEFPYALATVLLQLGRTEEAIAALERALEAVPRHVLTQGLGTILQARHLVLVASGRGKAEAVHQLVEGAVSAMWPGSVLQLHPHVSVLVDEAAAGRLQLADYYRETWRAKPAWQGL